jgi:glutathione synthase/RimK-type ligase-like ATP-grasp enzyme
MSPIHQGYILEDGNWLPMTNMLNEYINKGGLVVKDNSGSSGNLVFRAQAQRDLEEAVFKVFRHSSSLALSPFEQIDKEYRIIMLDGEQRLVYEKVRDMESEEWRHNLGKGAYAKLETDPAITSELTELAKRATGILNLRFASVDIIINAEGERKIMEVNSGVMMEHLANQGGEEYEIVKKIYRNAILKMFED